MFVGARRTLLRRVPVAAGGASAEVQQFLDRATGMDATHVNAFTALIDGLVADAVWSSLDVLYILATDTEAHAKLNVKSSSYTATETGTLTWTADVGYTSAGSAANYVLSGFNPSTAGGNYALDSAMGFFWVNSNSGGAIAVGGEDASGRRMHLYASGGDGNAYSRMNANGGISASNGGSANGSFMGCRTASNVVALYKNGSSIATGTTASVALPNIDLCVNAQNQNGTISAGAFVMSAFALGAGLDATKALALHNRVATYRTAVGL